MKVIRLPRWSPPSRQARPERPKATRPPVSGIDVTDPANAVFELWMARPADLQGLARATAQGRGKRLVLHYPATAKERDDEAFYAHYRRLRRATRLQLRWKDGDGWRHANCPRDRDGDGAPVDRDGRPISGGQVEQLTYVVTLTRGGNERSATEEWNLPADIAVIDDRTTWPGTGLLVSAEHPPVGAGNAADAARFVARASMATGIDRAEDYDRYRELFVEHHCEAISRLSLEPGEADRRALARTMERAAARILGRGVDAEIRIDATGQATAHVSAAGESAAGRGRRQPAGGAGDRGARRRRLDRTRRRRRLRRSRSRRRGRAGTLRQGLARDRRTTTEPERRVQRAAAAQGTRRLDAPDGRQHERERRDQRGGHRRRGHGAFRKRAVHHHPQGAGIDGPLVPGEDSRLPATTTTALRPADELGEEAQPRPGESITARAAAASRARHRGGERHEENERCVRSEST